MTTEIQTNQEDRDYVDFGQYLGILKRRWLPAAIVASSIIGLTGAITFQQKPVYEAGGKLLFNKSNRASALTGLAGLGELSGLTQMSNPLDTEAEIIKSHPLIQKTINKLNLKDKKGQPLKVEDFLKKLKVKSVKGTDVLELTYQSTDPQQAAAVVNSLMEDYQQNNIRSNTAEARAAKEFLSKRVPEVERRVQQTEVALRRFKERNNVVALQEEAKVGVESLNGLSQSIIQAQATLANANTRTQALQGQLQLTTQQAMKLSTLSQSTSVQQVLAEYQKAQDELAVIRTRFTDEHPEVTNLAKKEQALREQLEGRVGKVAGSSQPVPEQNLQIGKIKEELSVELVKSEVERLALAKQVSELRNEFVSQKARLQVLPKLEQQQRELERRLQVAQSTYQQVVKQLQEVEVVEQQNVGNARTIASALVPDKPVSPKIALNLALGGVLGFLLGAGTALVLESMDKTLKTLDQAKQLLGFPLLGTIPLDEDAKKNKDQPQPELVVLNNPYSPACSAFEILQTNLSFTLSDKRLQVLVVTSSVPGEGKSYIAANLAVAIGQLGRRVLLIDADMRRCRQHDIWEVPNMMGLSNVLVGQAEFENIASEPLVGLDLLTAGKTPPNALALLDSQRMASVVQRAREDYDFIIIDAPPVTAVADALVAAKVADGMLLVCRPGVADTGAVTAAKSLLQQSGQRVLGMVVNGVTGSSGYGGYYYRKGYHGIKGHEHNGNGKVKGDFKLPKIKVG